MERPQGPNTLGLKENHGRASLVVQWLKLCASYEGGIGLIPGQGHPRAVWDGQLINKIKSL